MIGDTGGMEGRREKKGRKEGRIQSTWKLKERQYGLRVTQLVGARMTVQCGAEECSVA